MATLLRRYATEGHFARPQPWTEVHGYLLASLRDESEVFSRRNHGLKSMATLLRRYATKASFFSAATMD